MIPFVSALLLTVSSFSSAWVVPRGPVYLGVSYGNKAPSDPLYEENLFDLFYPDGACTLSPGCNNNKYPVAVFIRGGNTNNLATSPNQISPFCELMRKAGFIVATPSYHIVDVSIEDDYLVAASDLGRMVQYLRRFKTILNIDPNQVFCVGHSGGGFYSYFLGLNVDFQNLASADLVERESSRPNFIAPWGALTDWDCMDLDNPATNPALLQMFLNATAPDPTLIASPSYWLQNPDLYGRTFTPPMCLVYNLSWQTPCGQITDFHDGYFGTWMQSLIKRFCGGSGMGQSVCYESTLLDSNGDPNVVTQNVVDWMKAKL